MKWAVTTNYEAVDPPVAMLVSYSDPANLYRAFHRETGQTLLQYRARLEP